MYMRYFSLMSDQHHVVCIFKSYWHQLDVQKRRWFSGTQYSEHLTPDGPRSSNPAYRVACLIANISTRNQRSSRQFLPISPNSGWVFRGGLTFNLGLLLSSKNLGSGFKDFLNFHPYLGKIPNLASIFEMGWNHQPAIHCWFSSMSVE